MQLGQQPGLPPAQHAMHQPMPMQHHQQQQPGQSPLCTSGLTTGHRNVCVLSTGRMYVCIHTVCGNMMLTFHFVFVLFYERI